MHAKSLCLITVDLVLHIQQLPNETNDAGTLHSVGAIDPTSLLYGPARKFWYSRNPKTLHRVLAASIMPAPLNAPRLVITTLTGYFHSINFAHPANQTR